MNKYYFALIVSFISFDAFAKAWVWDEIAQEAEVAEQTTWSQIIMVGILCIIIWLGLKTFNYLKGSEKVKYLKIRKTTTVVCFIITALLPFSILNYFDLKKESLESEANHSLNKIIKNAGSYIEVDNGGYASFNEIQPRDNQLPNNQITLDWVYKLFLSQGATPYDGIYRCFNIGTSGFQVVFAGDAKRKGCSSEDAPALFHGWIKPYRIRYYSADNIDPNRDLGNVFHGFIGSFIKEHNAQLRDDITNDFFYRSLNEYYEIRHIPSGDEMWADNKLYYENDIVQERSYEYKTINYGNYDITYCISRPCKLGVCEKYIQGSIFGKDIFGEIHLVKRNEVLSKYCFIWIVFLGVVTTIFFFGNPSRK
ncbi:MAG: hypothetical protein K2H99_07055 [Paramuribaculum sp.]|nr:hypothetical protein [Paramuribaculum sp.]MDE5921511.1 hypothetical protein [Paramuribaculum sp.]